MKLDNTKPIEQVIEDQNQDQRVLQLFPKQKFVKNAVIIKHLLIDEQTAFTLASVALHSNCHINDLLNDACREYVKQFK